MKKLATLVSLGAVVLVTAACGTQKVDMSFDDAYEVFMDSQSIAMDQELLMQTMEGSRESNGSFSLTADDERGDVKIDAHMISHDSETMSGDIDMSINIDIAEQAMAVIMDFSLFQAMDNGMPVQLLKIDEFSISGLEAMQVAMINSVVDMLKSKWIEIDGQENMPTSVENPVTQTKQLMNNLFSVMGNLSSYSLLENKGQTTYEEKTAFNVQLNNDEVMVLVADILKDTSFVDSVDLSDIEDADIQGVLVLQDTDHVELHITSIDGHDTTHIGFLQDAIVLEMQPREDNDGTISALLEKVQPNTYKLTAAVDTPDDDEINIDMMIMYDMKQGSVKNTYNGKILIQTQDLVEAIQTDTLTINIQGESENTKLTEDVSLEKPTEVTPLTEVMDSIFGGMMGGADMSQEEVMMDATGSPGYQEMQEEIN